MVQASLKIGIFPAEVWECRNPCGQGGGPSSALSARVKHFNERLRMVWALRLSFLFHQIAPTCHKNDFARACMCACSSAQQ